MLTPAWPAKWKAMWRATCPLKVGASTSIWRRRSRNVMHGRPNIVCRHIVCQHRVEVEVSPATAEVCFQDERFAHPFNTMVQFQAYVYNAPSNRVTWQGLNPQGGAGAGTIDAGGLYVAPLKGVHPYSLTDLVVATSVDDPFRRALAHVAIVGLGPEP